jgi:hypothetical protein
MKTKRRGRVKGRVLKKHTPDLVENSTWNTLFRRSIFGEGDYAFDLADSVEMCLALERKASELERQWWGFKPERVLKALRRWKKKPDGTEYGEREAISYEPAKVVAAGRHDRHRDGEIYGYFVELLKLHAQQDKAAQLIGGILVEAIRKRDPSTVLKMIELAGRQSETQSKWIDPTRAWFLLHVGKDAQGKLRRYPPYNPTWLAKLIGCDKRTVIRLCDEFRVTLRKGKPGRTLKPK